MNEQQLREALRAIAREEIPEKMDRWHEIQAQVRPKSRGVVTGWSMARIAIVIAVLLMALGTLAVGYAVFRQWFDPGMRSVEEAGLITPMQITALPTINAAVTAPAESTAAPTPLGTAESEGVVATLDSLYADDQQVAITYTIRNLPPEEQGYFRMFNTNISYADGSMFNASSGGGADPGPEPGSMIGQTAFGHHEPIPENGILDVVFTIQVSRFDTSVSDADPEVLYTFRFPVTLHFITGFDVQVEDTQVVNGIAITLKSLRITPSATQLIVCYDLPEESLDWAPDAEVSIDGQAGLLIESGITGLKSDWASSPRCLRMSYSTPYTPDARHLTLTVNNLHTSPSESPSEVVLTLARERLAAQGIEVSFKLGDHSFGWDVIRAPEGMDQAAIGKAVWDALGEQVPGPWVFEVDIPQGE